MLMLESNFLDARKHSIFINQRSQHVVWRHTAASRVSSSSRRTLQHLQRCRK